MSTADQVLSAERLLNKLESATDLGEKGKDMLLHSATRSFNPMMMFAVGQLCSYGNDETSFGSSLVEVSFALSMHSILVLRCLDYLSLRELILAYFAIGRVAFEGGNDFRVAMTQPRRGSYNSHEEVDHREHNVNRTEEIDKLAAVTGDLASFVVETVRPLRYLEGLSPGPMQALIGAQVPRIPASEKQCTARED